MYDRLVRPASHGVFTSFGISLKVGLLDNSVVSELIDVRSVNTDESVEYRDSVLLEDDMVASDAKLSRGNILSVITQLLRPINI